MPREQHWLVFGLGTLCFVPSFLLLSGPLTPEVVALYLLLACLLGIRLWLGLAEKKAPLLALPDLAACGIALAAFGSAMLPLAAVLCADLCAGLPGGRGPVLSGLLALLLATLTRPGPWALVCTLLALLPTLYALALVQRLAAAREAEAAAAAQAEALRRQLAAEERGAKALEQAARLEERGRLAARIHDKIGHGVSGSILLLEGAMLAMGNSPQAARETVEAATQNLRTSVDEIRAALREERAPRAEAGLASVRALLAAFGAQHPSIQAQLETAGRLDEVPPDVWQCIEENLREALTNLLKHSSANEVQMRIERQAKLLRVAIRDNGGGSGPVVPGIGLEAMAERCARCGGRMFAEATRDGFNITMTFTEARSDIQ